MAQFSYACENNADIILRSCSGYNTRWALCVMEGALPPQVSGPDAVVIDFGTNDATVPHLPSSASFQHVSVSEYKENLKKMIKWSKSLRTSNGDAPIVVLVSPAPVDEKARAVWAESKYLAMKGLKSLPDNYPKGITDRKNSLQEKYALVAAEAAKECGADVFINMYKSFFEHTNDPSPYFCDGLHYSRAGQDLHYAIFAREVELQAPKFW